MLEQVKGATVVVEDTTVVAHSTKHFEQEVVVAHSLDQKQLQVEGAAEETHVLEVVDSLREVVVRTQGTAMRAAEEVEEDMEYLLEEAGDNLAEEDNSRARVGREVVIGSKLGVDMVQR
jgi:hypothetical protein